MTINEIYLLLKKRLKEAGINTADLDARIIIENRTGFDWAFILAKGTSYKIEENIEGLMQADLMRRLQGEPLSRIYGLKEFWGLEFHVTPDVLDPRPESELIVERGIDFLKTIIGNRNSSSKEHTQPVKILDLGTGSGCLLISLLKEFPKASGIGVDLSLKALLCAQENAKKHLGVKCFHAENNQKNPHSDDSSKNNVQGVMRSRIQFICSDWSSSLEDSFDLIISNPPYIKNRDIPNLDNAVKKYDPILALDGGEDGYQAYKNIFFDLKRLLKPCGKALLEIGFDQEKNILRLAEESRFSDVSVHHDLAGLARVVEISSGDK